MSPMPPTPAPSMPSLGEWLGAIGLSRLEPLLRDNGIAEDIVTSLTEADLEKLGMSMGDRKRLMRAIAALSGAPAQTAAAPATTGTPEPDDIDTRQSAPTPTPASPELRQLTIMFCDLVDATALCARLTPEQWRQVVLAYQQAAVGVITRCGGTVAQYLGDGLLVYFGYPQAMEDAAVRAVHAGLDLVRQVAGLDIHVDGYGEVRLQVRIGIDTGRVVIGAIGAGPRREQLALGDTPNIAARLQGLARVNTVLISDQTRRLTTGGFTYEDQGVHSLKGVKEPRQVWRVTGLSETASRFDAHSGEQLSPLVGRVQELSLLTDRWQTVLQGQGQVVLLSGEPGIGKSRMLKELCDRLGNAGLNALQLQCVAHKSNNAFHPFIDCLERALRFKPEMPVAAKLDRIDEFVRVRLGGSAQRAALLAAMLSLPSDGRHELAITSAAQREQDFIELVLSLLEDRASHQPSLVIFEDAHWADPASIGALNKIVERTRHLPLLVVVTHRPEFVPAFERQAHVTALKVPGLRRAEVLALVNRLMGDAALPPALTQQIENRTDGVPLFVEELTKTLMEGAGATAGTGAEAALPATLRDSLMARLDRHARAKEIAQIGAVIGREFGHELLAALMPPQQGTDLLDDGIQDLLRSGLAMRQETEQGAVYVFKHAMVQDTAYDSLPKERREGLHAAIVDALESRYPETALQQPALLARHASSAGQGRRAIPYWRRASEQALNRLALHEAASHLQSGIDTLGKLPAGTDRDQTELQLRASLGTVHMLGKGWAAPEVAQAYQRANELASAADKVDEAIWPLWGVCVYHQVHGEITQAQAIGRRMATVARQSNSRNAWLVNNMMQAQLSFYSGQLPEVPGLCEQVEHGFNDPQDRNLIALYSTDLKLVAMVHGLHAQWIMGQVDDVDSACDAIEQRAQVLNHPYSLAWARTWGMITRLHAGQTDLVQVERLLPKLEAGLAVADEHGFAYVSAMARFAMGWCQTQLGQAQAGIALMDEGLQAFQDTGAGIVLPFFLTLMAEAFVQAGRFDEAGECLALAWLRIGKGGERWHEAELHRIRGDLLARAPHGDLAQARHCYRQAMEVAQAQQANMWRLRAATALAALD